MTDNIKRLSEVRQKKERTQKEIEEFAKRRRRQLKEISKNIEEPDYLASGTQKTIEEICNDEKNDE